MEAETNAGNQRKQHPLSNCAMIESKYSNENEHKEQIKQRPAKCGSKRSRRSASTMAMRFGPKNSKAKDHNYDSVYFEQFSWRDSGYYNLRVRWLQLISYARSKSHLLIRDSKRHPNADEAASVDCQANSLRYRAKGACTKFGRKVKHVWINGMSPLPQRSEIENPRQALQRPGGQFGMCRRGSFNVEDEIFKCLGQIDFIWDDACQMSIVERLVRSVPRMIELRMLIQYEFLEPLKSCAPKPSAPHRGSEARDSRSSQITPATSGSSGQRSSAASNGLTLVGSHSTRNTTSAYGPIPVFPYNDKPAPNPAVVTLLQRFLEQDQQLGSEANGTIVNSGSTRSRLPFMTNIEPAATILRLKTIDIIGELEFYVSILSGEGMNLPDDREYLRLERQLDERQRSVQRNLSLLLGNHDRFDQRRVLWMNRQIWQEKRRLQDLALSHSFEFGVTVVDGQEDTDEPSRVGDSMRGALWIRRRHSIPSFLHPRKGSSVSQSADKTSGETRDVRRRSSFCGFEKRSI